MDFDERTLFVVRNFIEYGRYGGDKNKAVKTIRRHHPEKSPSICQDMFDKYVRVYSDTITFVNDNKDYYWALKNHPANRPWPITEQEAEFIQKHNDIPRDIILSMIWFIFDWHHVR